VQQLLDLLEHAVDRLREDVELVRVPRIASRRERLPATMADAVWLISCTSPRSARRTIHPENTPSTRMMPEAPSRPYRKRCSMAVYRVTSRPTKQVVSAREARADHAESYRRAIQIDR